jgi:hypothetical protein
MAISINEWLAGLEQKRHNEAFKAGWDWAAGSLLEGTSVEELEAQINNSDSFDKGANAAIRKWENLNRSTL